MQHIITAPYFPGFDYAASQLSAYIFSLDSFILALKDTEEVTRFTAADADLFRSWLTHHSIRDITGNTGSMIMDYYFKK
jgi:hypothetical protein